jgi:hypothetical protein
MCVNKQKSFIRKKCVLIKVLYYDRKKTNKTKTKRPLKQQNDNDRILEGVDD